MLDYKRCENPTERHHPVQILRRTGLLHSAAMKLSLIVAVVVLALAQTSLAQDAPDLEQINQYFEDMKNKMAELLGNPDLAGHAQTVQSHLEPLAAKFQEQLKTVATNVEEQIKPMATSVQDQVRPMVESLQRQMMAFIERLTEQTKSIGN